MSRSKQKPATLADFTALTDATAKLADVTARRDALASEIAALESALADTAAAAERQAEAARRLLAGQPAIKAPSDVDMAAAIRSKRSEFAVVEEAIRLQTDVVRQLRADAIDALKETVRPTLQAGIRRVLAEVVKLRDAIVALEELNRQTSSELDGFAVPVAAAKCERTGIPFSISERLAETVNGWLMALQADGWIERKPNGDRTTLRMLTSRTSNSADFSGALGFGDVVEMDAAEAERMVASGQAEPWPSRTFDPVCTERLV